MASPSHHQRVQGSAVLVTATGQAKGVMRSQRKRIVDSMTAALTFHLNGDDHMLRSGPQFHRMVTLSALRRFVANEASYSLLTKS